MGAEYDPKEDQAPEVTTADLAGFWIRLASTVIDGLLLAGGSWIVTFLIGQAIGVPDAFMFPTYLRRLWLGLAALAALFYLTTSWKSSGQTLGKRALGIRVIRTDARPLDWNAALLRFLGYVISWASLSLLFLVVAFDGRKQGLHDKMADTYVIVVPRKKARVPEARAYAAVEKA